MKTRSLMFFLAVATTAVAGLTPVTAKPVPFSVGVHSIGAEPKVTTEDGEGITATVTMETPTTNYLIRWAGRVTLDAVFWESDKGPWQTGWQDSGMSQSFDFMSVSLPGNNTWTSVLTGCQWYQSNYSCILDSDAAVADSTLCICGIPNLPWPRG